MLLPLNRFLDTTGDGTGTKNAAANYSVTPTNFLIAPPAATVYILDELVITFADAAPFAWVSFGSIAALTAGIVLKLYRGATELEDYHDGLPVKQTAGFHQTGYTVLVEPTDTVNQTLQAKLKLNGLKLNGDASEKLQVRLNDNLSGLLSLHFLVRGHEVASNAAVAGLG